MNAEVVLRDGTVVYAKLIREYCAVEGGVRYIFNANGYDGVRYSFNVNGCEVRCTYDNMNCNYRELVI